MPRPEAVTAQVRDALQRHGLGSSRLLAAVSGGSDSMALLHALHALRESMALELHVAHFDHNFRPEAKEDALFVAEAAAALGLPLITEHGDPMAYQREQRISSFEAAARELRYAFLGRAAAQAGASAVALGHHADDQAETVLMHLLRGSGLDGLRGMGPLTRWSSADGQQQVNLFRPLLALTKEQLADYCRRQGVAFREDPANRDCRFTRNRVRHQLLPTLREYNPRISQSLVRLAQAVDREADFLEAASDRIWGQLARLEPGAVHLDRSSLAAQPPALQARLLRRAYRELAGSSRRLQSAHVDAMMSLLTGEPGRQAVLPMGLRLTSTYHDLILARDEGALPSPLPLEGWHRLAPPDHGAGPMITDLPGWRVRAEWVGPQEGLPRDSLTALLDLGEEELELWVRGRRPGDRFHPLGLAGDKKLQDFLVDQKAPAAWRDAIPLVVVEGRIAWVVGYRIAHWAAVRADSRRALRLQFQAEG